MPRSLLAVPVVLMALVSTGCSQEPDGRSAQQAARPTTSPSSSGPATPATVSTPVDTTRADCRLLDTLVSDLLFKVGMSGGDRNDHASVRAGVTMAYGSFADHLGELKTLTSERLRPVLEEWASASAEVANYVAGTEPPPGVVVDLGPSHQDWRDAEKAAEEVCGHSLPEH